MTRRTRRIGLWATLIASSLLLAAFVANGDLTRNEERPADAEALARWIAERPADWFAASALSDRSLDSGLPRRRELWRESHALARYLAPHRTTTAIGFVRAGLFHWYELGPADRKTVLDIAATLMRDPAVFTQLLRPLWDLTRDFQYLRRVAPPTLAALDELRAIAVTNGLFTDYRELRAALRAARLHAFNERRADLQPDEMLRLLPDPLVAADAPLVRAILEELDRRAYEPRQLGGRATGLAEFALDHGIQPLSALSPLVEEQGTMPGATRARLARALGDPAAAARIELTTADAMVKPVVGKWLGLCSTDEVCTSATLRQNGPLNLKLSISQSDEVPPYVEIYADGHLAAEGEIRDVRAFAIAASPSMHRFEVRVANPRTRNGIQRRVRLS